MNRSIVILPFILFLSLLVQVSLAEAQSPGVAPTGSSSPSAVPTAAPEEAGHFELDTLNPMLEKDLLLRAFGLPSNFKDEPRVRGEPILVEPWKGNTPELAAEIKTVTAVFVSPGSGDDQARLKISFDFQPDGVVVRSSRVANQDLASGLNLKDRHGSAVHVYLDTGDKYGFALVMPPITNPRGSLLRVGLLVCPRWRADTKSSNSKNEAIGNTDLTIDHLEFEASAFARGKLISGISPGLAKASVLTTENMAKGELSLDEAYSSDPEAAVEYHPDTTEKLAVVGDSNQSSGAIVATLELHNSAGYRRITTMRDAVWISRVENVDGFDTQDSSGNNVKIGPGECYAVFDEKSALNKFSKEPLVIPLDKLTNDHFTDGVATPTPKIAPGKRKPPKRSGFKFKWSLKRG